MSPRHELVMAALATAALAAGCAASGPRPAEELASAKTLIDQAFRQVLEMAFETFERGHTLVEQHVRAGAFEIAPQRIDREIFLVLEVIEERSLGDAGGLGNVLDRTSLEAEGMQRIYRAAGEFLAQAGSGHERLSRGFYPPRGMINPLASMTNMRPSDLIQQQWHKI